MTQCIPEPVAVEGGCDAECGADVCNLLDGVCQAPTTVYANSGVTYFDGPVIGTGADNNDDLLRVIPVTLQNAAAAGNDTKDVAFAYVVRTNATSTTADIILPVRLSAGAPAECFTNFAADIKNAGGTVLETDSVTYVEGMTHSLTASGIETNTCLEAGDTGFGVLRPVGDVFATAASVDILFEAPSSYAYTVPQGLRVTNYSFASDTLSVTVQNTGSAALDVSGSTFNVAILLDEHERPLWSLYIDPPSAVSVPAGGTTTLVGDLTYAGTAQSLIVVGDWDIP